MAKTQNEQRVIFFTPWQIYVASCLGSPLAATWLTVRNHRALQQPEQVRQTMWLGIVAMLVVVTVAFALPSSMPVAVWPFLYSIAGYSYAQRIFKTDTAIHIVTTGQRGAWWRVVLIGFGCFFVLFGVMLALAFAFPGLFPGDSQPTA